MDLWIRSTARTNLLKVRFLTIMEGKKFYEADEWEYKGYTICNCNPNGRYELLGTYKTKERALEVLDEIEKRICLLQTIETTKGNDILLTAFKNAMGENEIKGLGYPYQMPID